jgi:predicted metal-dependent HD superfamily phosphohydrolase
MEHNLNFLIAAYQASSDKTNAHVRSLDLTIKRRAEVVRSEIKRMILAICRAERWSLSRLDFHLSALEAVPVSELERYRTAIRQEYAMASRVLV